MPTENLKISTYLPQVVYEKFKQFKEERKVTFSQAAIEIFAEYFGIDLEKSTVRTTGGLPATVSKLEELAEKVEKLESMFISFSGRVEQGVTLGTLPKVEQGSTPNGLPIDETQNSTVLAINPFKSSIETSDLPSELVGRLPLNGEDLGAKHSSVVVELSSDNNSGELGIEEVNTGGIQGEPESKLLDKNGEPVLVEDISFKLDGDVIYLDTSAMALRLDVTEATLRARKSILKGEDFINWLLKHDPDKVRWGFLKQGRKVQYVTPNDLSQELKDKIIESVSNPKPSKKRGKVDSKLDSELPSDN